MKIFLTCTGLIFDMTGVVLLYYFGLPSDVTKDGHKTLVTGLSYKSEKANWDWYKFCSKFGLFLIFTGFFLQFISALLKEE